MITIILYNGKISLYISCEIFFIILLVASTGSIGWLRYNVLQHRLVMFRGYSNREKIMMRVSRNVCTQEKLL